jgi:hypothetical protein
MKCDWGLGILGLRCAPTQALDVSAHWACPATADIVHCAPESSAGAPVTAPCSECSLNRALFRS